MSDDAATNQWDANIGITLPFRSGATHNGGLSPLFFARDGYGSANDRNVWYRGAQGRLWSRNSAVTKSTSAMYLVVTLETVLPSSKDKRLDLTSLRCLVSTNNSIIIKQVKYSVYLVSDDDNNSSINANQGVTLPEGLNATHNASLSPLFTIRSGFNRPNSENMIYHRGRRGFLWSHASLSETEAYFFGIGSAVQSSGYNTSSYALSLRCLVSTNNGL